MTARGGALPAGLLRRLGASVYEALVLAALLLGLSFALLPFLAPDAGAGQDSAVPTLYRLSPGAKAWSGALLLAVCGAYCVGLWSGGRRTLPMKTWQLELRTVAGTPVGPRTAAVRFLVCAAAPLLALTAYAALQPLGAGRFALWLLAATYAWALVDPDHQFLQDRVAGTRLRVAAARP